MKLVIENDQDLNKALKFVELCMKYMNDDTLASQEEGNELFHDILDKIEKYETENYPILKEEVLEAIFQKVKKIEAKLVELENKIN